MIPYNWTWKDFKLVLPGFMVIRLYSSYDTVEMSLKIKEESGERQELIITYDFDSFQEFIKALKKINSKIEKKDFGSQVLEYSLFSSDKIQIGLYFNKEDFSKLWRFLEDCSKQIEEQAREYKELAKGDSQSEK